MLPFLGGNFSVRPFDVQSFYIAFTHVLFRQKLPKSEQFSWLTEQWLAKRTLFLQISLIRTNLVLIFLSRVIPAGIVGGRKGHLLIVNDWPHLPHYTLQVHTAGQEEGLRPHDHAPIWVRSDSAVAHCCFVVGNVKGRKRKLANEVYGRSSMNCKHPPDDYPDRFPVLLLISTPRRGHLAS